MDQQLSLLRKAELDPQAHWGTCPSHLVVGITESCPTVSLAGALGKSKKLKHAVSVPSLHHPHADVSAPQGFSNDTRHFN